MDTRNEQIPQTGDKFRLFAGPNKELTISGEKLDHQFLPAVDKFSLTNPVILDGGKPGVKGDDRRTLRDPDDPGTNERKRSL